ncbi:glycoside hydrolase family 95 protein [Streptosporangiaceae bacterium NEAU-GS5]|nr:glycoside hydrolase family 95 protein [Streptosporangiaceae bacterium NEAU-GS5]
MIWYDEPADDWERHALPIGNGTLGGMVFGRIRDERVALNHSTLWTGGPGSAGGGVAGSTGGYAGNWREPRPGVLDQVRRTIAAEGSMEPGAVARLLGNPAYATTGSIPGFGAYQPLGDLLLVIPDAGPVSGYRRTLDLRQGIAGVSYVADGVTFTRECFASNPAGVLVLRLAADRPGRISATIRLACPYGDISINDGKIVVRGVLPDNGLRVEAVAHVSAAGGILSEETDRISVSDADAVTVIVAAGTDYALAFPTYRGPDPHEEVAKRIAAAHEHADLRAEHVADFADRFDRVRLDLGPLPEAPTSQALATYTGERPEDRGLEALYFQYGRYLLISSSRENSPLPANLQGIWNDSSSPPWDCDWHANINVQMNYWPAEVTNLAESVAPLLRFIESLRAPGRITAREMFGAPGWVVGPNTNAFGFTGVHDWPTSFWFPEAGAWLARHAYERYRFSGDEAYLREHVYPLLKETAEFWLANLVADARDGALVVSPSYSPEHGLFTAGAAMSQQIVAELLSCTLAVAQQLRADIVWQSSLARALGRLDRGLRVGSWGQLQEWKDDLDDPDDTHRHVSQLYALYPGDGPVPADAARTTLDHRGDRGTGWSQAWKINFWARLLDGDRAHKLLSNQLQESTLPNLLDTHPPFQIDGNFGAAAGIAEMLLQSHAGEIHVLPALPAAWADGSFDGLRARGGHTVGATWSGGRATEVRIRADRDGRATVRAGDVVVHLDLRAGVEIRQNVR